MPDQMRYQFIIDGELSDRALALFPELTGAPLRGTTSLHGPIADRTGISSVLARLDNLGLTLIELRQLPD